ncbi:hypothetical protein BDF19DRAFT_445992 [Syncephalis fuscata]|nr:hypothetical protein BDF19DRAFT_445992 [Syncephalis fuscata]
MTCKYILVIVIVMVNTKYVWILRDSYIGIVLYLFWYSCLHPTWIVHMLSNEETMTNSFGIRPLH